MPAARFILSLLLALSLSMAPVLHGLANAALSSPDVTASEHAGHTDAAHQQHKKTGGICATHDVCNGQCCMGCTHSFTGVSLLLSENYTRSVLTPAVQYLVTSSPSFARERPPRLFSL